MVSYDYKSVKNSINSMRPLTNIRGVLLEILEFANLGGMEDRLAELSERIECVGGDLDELIEKVDNIERRFDTGKFASFIERTDTGIARLESEIEELQKELWRLKK